jgi:hypothetical protein
VGDEVEAPGTVPGFGEEEFETALPEDRLVTSPVLFRTAGGSGLAGLELDGPDFDGPEDGTEDGKETGAVGAALLPLE